MKLSDDDLVRAVKTYRTSYGGRHGPPSLKEFALYLHDEGYTDDVMAKSGLSVRIGNLVRNGRLVATIGPDGQILTFSLEENEHWEEADVVPQEG